MTTPRVAAAAVAVAALVVGLGADAVAGSSYVAARSQPRADRYYPGHGDPSVDALHYGIHLSWDDARGRLVATTHILFRAPRDESRIHLDLDRRLHVDSLTVDGTARSYDHSGNDLVVDTGQLAADDTATLVVRYHGVPRQERAPVTRADIPGVGWKTQPSGATWTMQEPWGAATWFPVNDHPSDKAFYDITVRARRDWRAVSNGELVDNTRAGDVRTMRWHLDAPAAAYLVTLAIGPYRRHADTGPHGVELSYWLRPGDTSLLGKLRRTPAMLEWLESRLGRYPFGSAGAVVVPARSAMETQTLVTMGRAALDSREGRSALVHEYAHQWYGDLVTPDNWRDLWLNESFAMYLEIRWDATHGVRSMRQWRRTLVAYDQYLRDQYGPPGDYDRGDWGSANVYYCGALMLDRLRGKIGHRDFAKVLRGWPQRRRYGTVHRSEWVDWLNDVTGRDMSHFVHRWLTAEKSPA